MSEPKNPVPAGGLPLDWSLSSLTPTATPSAVPAQIDVVVEAEAVPEAVTLPASAVASADKAMDLNVLGAIGSWQTTRTPTPMPTPPKLIMPEPVAPPPHEAAPVAPAMVPEAVRMPEAPVAPAPVAPAEPVITIAPPKQNPLSRAVQRVAFWRATTAIAAAAALVLAFGSGGKAPSFDTAIAPIGVVNTPAPIYVAELGEGRLRVTPLAIVAVPAARDLQLWMFLADSQTAISLGVLPATGGIFTLPQIPGEGARFVVSLEPHGGSTGGKITGDVLYGGTLAKR